MSFIYNEIKSQYDALARTQAAVDERVLDIAALLSKGQGALIFVGSGSSYTLARSAALIARLRLGRPAMAIAAGDLLLHMDSYRPVLSDCVLVVLSRSGETSEVILSIERLRETGIRFHVLGVPCVTGSRLTQLSDLSVELPWAFDRSVCQTRTVTCLYFFCAYAVAKLAKDEALIADLLKTVADGDAYMAAHEATLKAVAQLDWNHAVVLGDAEISGLCGEAALTFNEICQIPSNYYHLLDVRHGPMVLIGKQTLVFAVLSNIREKFELDLLRDVAAKGATIIVYSDEPLAMPGIVNITFGKPLSHIARGIPAIAVCQLITYYKSFITNANPDQPDGLAPWIALN